MIVIYTKSLKNSRDEDPYKKVFPIYAKEGDFFESSLDNTAIGWAWANPSTFEEYKIIPISKRRFIQRQININNQIPSGKSNAEIQARADNWYEEYWLYHAGTPYTISNFAVNIERDRRISLPKSVTINGTTFNVDHSDSARVNLNFLYTAALARNSLGDSTTTLFRDADNVVRTLSPIDIINMNVQIDTTIQALHASSRALKQMNPIPKDYEINSYWT